MNTKYLLRSFGVLLIICSVFLVAKPVLAYLSITVGGFNTNLLSDVLLVHTESAGSGAQTSFAIFKDSGEFVEAGHSPGYLYENNKYLTDCSGTYTPCMGQITTAGNYILVMYSNAGSGGICETNLSNCISSEFFQAQTTFTLGLHIPSSLLEDATVGVAYSDTVQADAGTLPYSWTISSGSLPYGLSIDGSTGEISGIPVYPGVSSFSAQVTDSNSAVSDINLSIIVKLPEIITTSLTSGLVSTYYSETLQLYGGVSPLVWSVISGSLPDGLSLESSTGEISGTPTTVGVYDFVVQVSDSNSVATSRSLSLTINPELVAILTESLADGKIDLPYSKFLQSAGGTAPLIWSVTAGSLPPGLVLSGSTGEIYGIPTSIGTYNFTIQVTTSNSAIDMQILSIDINPPANPNFSVLLGGVDRVFLSDIILSHIEYAGSGVQTSFAIFKDSGEFVEAGHSTSYSYDVGRYLTDCSDAFSPCLSQIMSQGNYVFVMYSNAESGGICETNLIDCVASEFFQEQALFTLGFQISTTSLPSATSYKPYSQTLEATGGTVPYTWSVVSGALPLGLSLSSTGAISGTPTVSGTFNFIVQVIDNNSQTATKEFALTVNPRFNVHNSVAIGDLGIFLRQGVVVNSGDLGANNISSGPFLDSGVETSIGNDVAIASAYGVFGDSVRVKSGATLTEVFFNDLSNNGTISGLQVGSLSTPVLEMPSFPSFSTGTEDFDIAQNGTLNLSPGSYGSLIARTNSTITMAGGTYTFSSWDIRQDAEVLFTGPVTIQIAGRLNTDLGVEVNANLAVNPHDVLMYIAGQNGSSGNLGATPKAAELGQQNTVNANIYAPNGTLIIKANSQATGSFLGKWVEVGNNTELTLDSGF